MDLALQDPLVRVEGQWQGMVGTATVAQGSSGEASGVDFTEYRGRDERRLGQVRQHRGRRSVRHLVHGVRRGRSRRSSTARPTRPATWRQIRSVDFSIAAADPDAPSVQGFADPSSGAAPLLVQFSATGLDPQGGLLDYEWDFGDGGGSFNQSPQHTYTNAGDLHGDRDDDRSAGQDGHRHRRDRRDPERQPGPGGEGDGRPEVGPGAAGRAVQRAGDRRRRAGERAHVPVGLRRRRRERARSQRAAHLQGAGDLHGHGDGDRSQGRVRHRRGRDHGRRSARATCRRPCRRRRLRGPARRRCG